MLSLLSSFSRTRMTREEYQKWVERVSQGFQQGEVIELSLKHVRSVMMASKGNIAVATPRHLFILVDLPYQPYQQLLDVVSSKYDVALRDARIVVEVVKSVPERKFTLARTRVFELVYGYTRSYTDFVVEKEGERVEVEGAELVISEGVERRWQEHGKITIRWNASKRQFEAVHEVEERIQLGKEKKQTVLWRVVDPSKPLGSFLARNQELLKVRPSSVYSDIVVFTDRLVVVAKARKDGITVKTCDIELPSEEELLQCSRFYTIVLPRYVIYEDTPVGMRRLAFLDIYYKGRKFPTVLSWVPENMLFRCLRMRYSISSYARRVLPRGVPRFFVSIRFFDLESAEKLREWTRMLREEILPKVRSLHSEPKKLEPLEAFLEVFYVNTPKRKVENVVKPWLELFEKVKDLAPKATLYITFYGQKIYRRRLPNYVGFKIEKDGTISLMNSRYVPVSGITMKGGEFERLYREAYVKKLFEYQVAPTSEKLEILWQDIEELRGMLEEHGVEPATAYYEEVREKLRELAKDYEGDNIVLLFFKHHGKLEIYKPKNVDIENAEKLLVGLVKSGRKEELQKLVEFNVLRVLRTVVKYEMKKRGYSIRKGVMFLGDPATVRRRILEVVRGIRGRLLALMEEFGEVEVEVPVAESLARVEALLKF